jgi:branched-chain amino acid aminotransferase
MSTGKYILVDGSFVPAADYRLTLAESESFHFTEKFRAIRTSFPFFSETLEVIKFQLNLFNQSFPEFTEREGAGLKRQLERTLTKNKHFMGACLKLTLRIIEGEIHFSISSEKLDFPDYRLNQKGIYVDVLSGIQKPVSLLSNFSVGSEIYWNIASRQAIISATDQFLITNTDQKIVEAPQSNIYILKGETVKGANPKHGAYIDVTQPLMGEIFEKLKFTFSDSTGISVQDIKEADEILIVNSIDGIKWVAGFENNRYFNNTTKRINDLFNQLTTN